MSNAEVTLVAPAIRTEWWLELYEALTKTNDTKFEVIFVGHIRPKFSLPDNFLYIYSKNTPAACVEIGFRATQTEYVMNVADDYSPDPKWLSSHVIDKCLEEHKRVESLGVEHFYVGPSFKMGPEEKFKDPVPLLYWTHDHHSPLLTISPLTKMKTNRLLQGPDSSFYGLYWDTDINMRLYEIGGQAKVMGMKFENNEWIPDPTSDDYVFFTERAHSDCMRSMKNVNTDTISRRNKGKDHRHFRNLWPLGKHPHHQDLYHKGITTEDYRHYYLKDKCYKRISKFIPFPDHIE